jgi:hypothetical protein
VAAVPSGPNWTPPPLYQFKNIEVYETEILQLVFYGCETWSLILKEEYRLEVFQNRLLKRLFGPMTERRAGGWRKIHVSILHQL